MEDRNRLDIELSRFAQKNIKLKRRDFLSLAVATGISSVLAENLWSRTASAANSGGSLRVGCDGGSTSDTLDPQLMVGVVHPTASNRICRNGLAYLGPNGEPVPDLAESWEVAKDAKTWRFNLRKGVEFHNGKSLTAEDVIASYTRLGGEKSKNADGRFIFSNFAEMKADGPNTVVFVQKQPNVDLAAHLSSFMMVITPADATEQDILNGIGTGPFRIKSFQPGVSTIGEKNPNYFHADRPHFNDVTLLNIPDQSARISALLSGQVDVISDPGFKTVEALSGKKGIKVIDAPGLAFYTMPMITTMAPFDNNDVRMAIKYGLDRERIVKTILNGHGYVGNDHPVARSVPGFAAKIEQHSYDPDKSKFYLKRAGLSSLDVELDAADVFPGALDLALLAAHSEAGAGVNVNVKRVPKDGYWDEVWMKRPWCLSAWKGRPTTDWVLSYAFSSSSPNNESFWKNEKFDDLLLKARTELDEGKRFQMYSDAQALVSGESGVIIPCFANMLMAASDKLVHGEVSGATELDNFRLAETWSFG